MANLTSDELSSLLAELYAAPLQPEKWHPFFTRLCELTECKLGVFLSADRNGENRVLAGGGVEFEPQPLVLYNSHYGAMDPFAAPAIQRGVTGLVSGDELVAREELVAGEFYNDLLRPHDLEHLTVMPCLIGGAQIDVVSFWRGKRQGPVGEGSLEVMRLMMPHMRSALQIYHALDALKERSELLEAMLSRLSAAAFMLDRRGLVISMNPAGEQMVRSGDCMAVIQRRLRMLDPARSVQWEGILMQALGAGGYECAPGGMTVLRGSARGTLQLLALPFLPEGSAKGSAARVLVFVHDPAALPRPRAELMRAIYGLTPTEGKLADLMLEGHEIGQIADRMRVTLGTARFHLKRVMAKTGARRQVELMRLMLLLPGY